MGAINDLFVRLGLDSTDYKKGLQDAKQETQGLQGQIVSFADSVTTKLVPALAAAGTIATIIKGAADLQEQYKALALQTGALGERLEMLKDAFNGVYAQTAASGEAVTAALTMIHKRTGATGEQLESLTLKMLALAKAANTDVAAVAPLVTRVFGDWGIATANQGAAMDLLRTIVQKTGVGLQQLADRVVFFGAPMRAMGFSFEQASALIGKFESEGVNTETVLTSLRFALGKLAKEGVSDTATAFRQLVESIKEAPNRAEGARIAFEAFGKRAAADMYAAIKEGRFDEFLSGEFARVEKAGTDVPQTIGEAWKKLMHSLEVTVAPVATFIVAMFAEALSSIAQMIEMVKRKPGEVWAAMKAAIPFIGGGGGGIAAAAAAAQAAGEYEVENTYRKQGPALPRGYDPKTGRFAGDDAGGGSGGDSGFMKWENPRVFADLSTQNALWVEQLRKEEQARKDLLKSIVESLQHIDHEKQIKGELLALSLGFTDGISEEARAYKALEDAVLACVPQYKDLADEIKRMSELFPGLNQQLGTFMGIAGEQKQAVDALSDAYKTLGINTEKHGLSVEKATQAYEVLKHSGIATTRELIDAEKRVLQAKIDNGEATDADIERYHQLEAASRVSLTKQESYWRSLGAQIQQINKRMWDQLERDLSQMVTRWEWSFDSIKKIGQDFAADMLQIFLKGLFKPLEDKMSSLAGSIGSSIGGIFKSGSGSSLPGGILTDDMPDIIGGVVQDGTSAATSASGSIGSAVGGIGGAVNMVSGAVSAVSSVVGNFQMMGMNKSLDVLVNHTLRIFNELFYFRQDAWSRHNGLFAKLDDMWNEIRNVVAAVRGGIPGGGGGVAPVFGDMLAAIREGAGNIFTRIGETNRFLEQIAASAALPSAPAVAGGTVGFGGAYFDFRGSQFGSPADIDQVMTKITQRLQVRSVRVSR